MRIVGTFGSFTTARLGIYASQQGLNVTGHNITNINTEGYTRQRLDQIALRTTSADRFAFTYNSMPGTGTLITGISQIRDPYLDIRFRNENASVGSMDAKLAGFEDIATILDEISRGNGNGVMEAQFNDMLKQIQNLSGLANQNEFDTLVRSSASSLVALMNSYATKLNTVHENQVAGFKQDITTVNNILKNIGDLNHSILAADIHKDPALELRDQRNLLIDQLSQYAKINVKYELVNVGAGEQAEVLKISLAGTAEGAAEAPSHGNIDTSRSTLIDGRFYTQMSATGPNFDIGLAPLKDSEGVIHGTLNTAVSLGDNDLYGALQAVRELLTEAGEFSTTNTVTNVDKNSTTKRGIPYYQHSLDALAQQFAAVLNKANSGYMYNEKGNYVNNLGQEILDGTAPIPKSIDLDDPANAAKLAIVQAGNGVRLGGPLFSNSSKGDDITGINATNISISKSWATGAVRIVNSFQMGNGDWSATNPARPGNTDSKNIEHILVQFQGKQPYKAKDVVSTAFNGNAVYFNGSFQEMLSNMNGTLANDMKTTSTLLSNYVASANELATNRDSVAGVDLNDETTSLMQYQKSFSAACRLMTTIDEALERLINNTGIVGR